MSQGGRHVGDFRNGRLGSCYAPSLLKEFCPKMRVDSAFVSNVGPGL